jgi:uncharacterized protein (DUF2141 family)
LTKGWAVYLARAILDLDAGFGTSAERRERIDMDTPTTVAVQVFPNPNKGEFHLLATSDMALITIVDLNGKKVLQQNAFGTEATIFSNLRSGIYLIHVTLTNGATATTKLVVE